VRACALILLICLLGACGSRTPQCTDRDVVGRIEQMARYAAAESLTAGDKEAKPDDLLAPVRFALTSISAVQHDRQIDKWSCRGELRVTFPPEFAALNAHPAFRQIVASKLDIQFRGSAIVVPVEYTLYQTVETRELMLEPKGLDVPARYIKRAHRAGALATDLTNRPDLHAGLTLYQSQAKHLLIQPAENGKLQFQVNYDNAVCRPWMQNITQERPDTLLYDNPAAGCSATFSLFGKLLLVEHRGCALMPESCFPDGIYLKQ